MTLHVHRLGGCAPTPLAWYLKGLGVLRLVAEQADEGARGFWRDEAFHLATRLTREELERFFLEEYSPTPLVAPWNGGSGFFYEDDPGLSPLESSQAARFSDYRLAIGDARRLIADLGRAVDVVKAIKAESKSNRALRQSPEYKKRLAAAERERKRIKDGLIPLCRATWRGRHLEWMEAAVVIGADGVSLFPALLGTGGNDGRLDFTNNFMQRLGTLFDCAEALGAPRPEAVHWLRASIWGMPTPGTSAIAAVGQFLPGGAGGANSTTGFGGDARVNPWDFVLMLEGAVLFAASVVRRTAITAPTSAAAPFAIRPTAIGYSTASRIDEESRGEQWMPLWSAPASLPELRRLLAEGRSQVGLSSAQRPVDFARALARLGVARGIAAFQRFGYIERNGQSNLATPLGRWTVAEQPRQELLDDLDTWVRSLHRATRERDASKSLSDAHRQLEEAILDVSVHAAEPHRWQALLVAMAEVERRLLASPGFTAKKRLRPIPPLRPAWVEAADDGSAEFRLALALASQAGSAKGEDPVRAHWMPLDPKGGFATDAGGLRNDPRVVCDGLDAERDLIALVRRRLIEGQGSGGSRLPLVCPDSRSARLPDLAALAQGSVDLDLVCDLARPFMALRRGPLPSAGRSPSSAGLEVDDLYALFRIAYLPFALPHGSGEVSVPADPAIFARLAAGDVAGAGTLAIRRLTASGLPPRLRRVAGDRTYALRLAASLAFPVSPAVAGRLACRILHNPEENTDGR